MKNTSRLLLLQRMAVYSVRRKSAQSQKSRADLMKRSQGFTLLELVVIITLVGIMASYAAVKWQPVATFTINQQAELLAQNIRHVQSLAMYWGVSLRLVPAGTQYSVVCVNGTGSAPCVNAGDTVKNPTNNSPFIVQLGDGLSISGFATEFDSGGRPVNGVALLTADRLFTLSVSGLSRTLVVKPVTGFVVSS